MACTRACRVRARWTLPAAYAEEWTVHVFKLYAVLSNGARAAVRSRCCMVWSGQAVGIAGQRHRHHSL